MTRLTNSIKKVIIDKAVAMAAADLKAAHTAALLDAQKAIIQTRLDIEVPKNLHKLVTELPAPFTRETKGDSMWVDYPTGEAKENGEMRTASVNVEGKSEKPLRIPAGWSNYQWQINIDVPLKEHPIYKAYENENNTRRELGKMESETRKRVTAVLDATGTVKKLLAAWPESRELIPDEILNPPKKPMLPAIQTDDLNARIGLPTDAKKVA